MPDPCSGIEVAEFGSGAGVPIVLLHEGLGSVALWRDFPARLALATSRRIIAWSRQGYGGSAAIDQPYGQDFMHREAEAAVRLFDRLGIEKAHLFGHSDGASIALLLAAGHPARAASLMLEAPHTFVEPICLRAIAQLASDDTLQALTAKLGRYHRAPEMVLSRWISIWLEPAFAAWSIEAEVARITAPVLLIQGAQDEYGTFAQLDGIARRLPWARQLRLEQCGHSPHRDREDDVLRAAAEFLEMIDAQPNPTGENR